jgi:hypothetical protein
MSNFFNANKQCLHQLFFYILKTDTNSYLYQRVIVHGFKQHYHFNRVKNPRTITGHAGKSLQYYPFKRVMAGDFQDSVGCSWIKTGFFLLFILIFINLYLVGIADEKCD